MANKRPKATVYRTFKEMEREGTLDQLWLPGFASIAPEARHGE